MKSESKEENYMRSSKEKEKEILKEYKENQEQLLVYKNNILILKKEQKISQNTLLQQRNLCKNQQTEMNN